MARRSLRPHLNQIRGWVRQGRTDAWIAHQLEVTVQDIEAFKRQNELLPDGEAPEAPGLDFDDEIDLRAEDDALIAAELVFGVSSGQGGLGWYIFENRNLLDIPAVFAGLLTMIIIGLIVENLIFRTIERNTVQKWGTQT